MAEPPSADPKPFYPADFHILTPRLTLSLPDPTSPSLCTFVFNLYQTPELALIFPDAHKLVPDTDAARLFLTAGRQRLDSTGWGRFLISLRPANDAINASFPSSSDSRLGEPIGFLSLQLHRFPPPPPPSPSSPAPDHSPSIPDLGFSLHPSHQGRGYATEACTALLDFFRSEKGGSWVKFAAFTAETNVDSKRLLRRLGFREVGVRWVEGIVEAGWRMGVSTWVLGMDMVDGDEEKEEEELRKVGIGPLCSQEPDGERRLSKE